MKPEPGTGTAPQPGRLPPIIDLGRALARNDIEYDRLDALGGRRTANEARAMGLLLTRRESLWQLIGSMPAKTASTLSADDPARAAARAVIVEEVERLHWRIWNGKARDAQTSIDRIRAVMHHFRGEPDQRRSSAPSRKLWTALRALDGYLTSQSAWSTTPSGTARACGWAPRSPKGRPTSW